MRIVSLDHLTVFELTPPELVTTAALAGFRHVGVRLNPAAPGEQRHPMLGDTPMLRETLARMASDGVSVLDVTVLRLKQHTDVAEFAPVLETAAKLRAQHVCVCADEPDEALMADLFGRLCDLADPYDLTMDLEFVPWTGVKTLAQAVRVVQTAARRAGRVLIDTLHVDRSCATAADIASAPRERIAYAQICDGVGPRPTDYETMIYQARNERALPGEGNLDLVSMIRALPQELPLSLEAPTRHRAEGMPALERARRGRAAVDALLARAAASEP